MSNPEQNSYSSEPNVEENKWQILEEIANKSAETREKPDYVKKIESFDMGHLDHEQIEFMVSTVQNYFKENFPIKQELIDELPGKISILGKEEYTAKLMELTNGELSEEEIEDNMGFYNEQHDIILIRSSEEDTPDSLFGRLFHECLHSVSLKAGAGFSSRFLFNENTEVTEESIYASLGSNDFIEGATQLIAYQSIYDDMGFDMTPYRDWSYKSERKIVETVMQPFGQQFLHHLYFETPTETVAQKIEEYIAFAKGTETDPTYKEFIRIYANIHAATEKLDQAYYENQDDNEAAEVITAMKRSVGHFMLTMCQVRGYPPTEQELEMCGDYLLPHLTENAEN